MPRHKSFSFITSLVFCIFALCTESFTKTAHAVDIEKWGPHLKDYGNEEMIRNVRAVYRELGGSDDTWIPFTVMVPGAKSPEDQVNTESRLREIFNAAKANNMLPIIRVTSKYCTGGWEKLDSNYSIYTKNAFNNVSNIAPSFPGSTIYVEWGNEINFAHEWGNTSPNPESYESAFVSFKNNGLSSVYTPTKAPLAVSGGTITNNGVDLVLGASNYYSRLTPEALTGAISSHAYEINKGGADQDTINAWKFDKSKYQERGANSNLPIIITEFGLAPGHGSFDQRIQFIKDNHGAYGSEIKYVTPLLLDDVAVGGTNQTKIIVFGPNGSYVMNPVGSQTSAGGGVCESTLPDAGTFACYQEGSPIPESEQRAIQGRATNTKVIPQGNGTFKRMDFKIRGLGVARIERPFNSKYGTPNSTYNYITTDDNGNYKLDKLSNGNTIIAAFCGGRLLRSVPINWSELGPGEDSKIHFDFADNNLDCDPQQGICTCPSNNYCVRASITEPPPEGYTAAVEPEQRELKFDWGQPEATKATGEALQFAKLCLSDLSTCAGSVAGSAIEFTLGGSTILFPDEFIRERDLLKQIEQMGYGIKPNADLPSCDEIKKINKESSGINLGRGGRTLVIGKAPSAIKKDAERLGNLPQFRDAVVCKNNDGEDIRLNQIQRPGEPVGPQHKLSSAYYPYSWLSKKDAKDDREDFSIGEGRAAAWTSADEEHKCGGVYSNPDGTICDEGKDSADNNTSTAITLKGSPRLAVVVQDAYVKMFSRPGKNVTTLTLNKRASSGISRGSTFGEEYVCPSEFRKADATNPKGYICTQGGVKFSIVEKMTIDLAHNLQEKCAASPGDSSCSLVDGSENAMIRPTLPYSYCQVSIVSDFLRIPGKEVRCEGGAGATAGDTKETQERFTYTQDTAGTGGKVAEEIMNAFGYKGIRKME